MRPGGLREAILHSVGANAAHGVRRSNADKRRAVLLLLEDEEWGAWTDREIARRCAVDGKTVARLREELTAVTAEIRSEDHARTYRDRHGNVTQMRTAGIGRKPDVPERGSAPEAASPPDVPEPELPLTPAHPGNVVMLGDRLRIMPSPSA